MAAAVFENQQIPSSSASSEAAIAPDNSPSRSMTSGSGEPIDADDKPQGSRIPTVNGMDSSTAQPPGSPSDDDDDDIPLTMRKKLARPSDIPNQVLDRHKDASSDHRQLTNDSLPKVKAEPDMAIKHEPVTPQNESIHTSSLLSNHATPSNSVHIKSEPGTPADKKRHHEPSDEDDQDDISLALRAKKIKKEEPQDDVHKEKHKDKKKKHKHHKEKHRHKDKDKKKHKDKAIKNDSKHGTPGASPTKKAKKEEEEEPVWRWWEEDRGDGTIKWNTLEHQGVYFPPPYDPLPKSIKFYYDGKHVQLSIDAEEVAGFYAKFLDHDYITKEAFNRNFFKDWRKVMTHEERQLIQDLQKCDFREIHAFYTKRTEERKNMSKEEKQKIKEDNAKISEKYGVALMDGYKQKVGNYRAEPPGLFRGRGDHPKMGMLKKRIRPEEIIINCGKGSKVPDPPPGHKWREVRHDNTVTWLACWNENIMGGVKYVMLNATSKLKGMKDWDKYEKARELNNRVETIRNDYREDWKAKEMKVRQRAVALYFIDKLALRAGNEKEEGETADTVGCCSLRVEHITLHDKMVINGHEEEFVVAFDFLGKDSIRYQNQVPVEKRVYKNVKLFMENKESGDDLFDRLNTAILNKYLQSLMPSLTAKVFRTYNASHTLQEQLKKMTTPDIVGNEAALVLAYNRANRAVAILCNHQRAPPKSHTQQMETIMAKIHEKKKEVKTAKKVVKAAKSDYKNNKSPRNKKMLEQKEKRYQTLKKALAQLEVKATDKEENKEISLGTSKLNYLDPRISVQWCLKYNVSLGKVYSKTHRQKFQWAIDMVTKDFVEDGKEFEF